MEATSGVGLIGGKLATYFAVVGGPIDAKIKGSVFNTGADVVIDDAAQHPAGTAHRFGVLLIEGTVDWTGGTYRPAVRAQNQGEADLWKSTGTFTVGANAKFAPGAIDAQGQPTGFPPAGKTWKILASNTRIIGNTPAPDPVGWKYSDNLANGIATEWYVGS